MLCTALLIGVTLLAQSDQAKPNRSADTKPKPFYTPSPEYTESARQDRIEGAVILSVNIDADGHPHDPKVLKSLRADLDEKAIEAVKTWRFLPATKDGKPVPFFLSLEIDFHLPSK